MRNWRFWQVVYEDVTKPFITPEQSIGQLEQGPLFVTIDSDGKQIPNEELDRLKVKLSEKEHELAISIIGGRRQQYHLDQYYRLVKVIDSTDAVFIVTSSSSRLEQAITRIFARTRALQQNNGSENNGPDRFRTESREVSEPDKLNGYRGMTQDVDVNSLNPYTL
ncbi:unnamed protein product [Anisakis simplex]|uniref:DUF4174 domain-containing protein n=1 Tax=Anisakis simplex TaxID=6269 RepID=A0A0M3K187_ANISI|nr:unnamed protein product [Anisakis simplex]